MKFILVAFCLLIISGNIFASSNGACANMAKSGAIRAYLNDVPGVDKDNLTYKATFKELVSGAEKYLVSVESPCSVDGDDSNCSMVYEVLAKQSGAKCIVQSVKEVK